MNELGIIKWYDNSKGFGVILTPSNGEYFLHNSNLLSKSIELLEHTPVIFLPGFERNKNTAKECHLPSNTDDLITILELDDTPQRLWVETKIKGESRLGNPYIRKGYKSVNLLDIAIETLFNSISTDEFFPLITEAYLKIQKSFKKYDYVNFFKTITKQINHLQIENTHQLLEKLFLFFGNNLSDDVIYSVWKEEYFDLEPINENYEITETILLKNIETITIKDLGRIQKYEKGEEICYNIVNAKIKDYSKQEDNDALKNTYDYLEFVKNDQKKEKLRLILDELLYKNSINTINEILSELPEITDKAILSDYEKLSQKIPTEANEIQKKKLSKIISDTIIEKSADQVKIYLWLSDYITEIEDSRMLEFLCDEDSQLDDRVKVLSKIYKLNNISSLLEQILEKLDPGKIFGLIEEFIKKENNITYHFDIRELLKEGDFGGDQVGYDLLKKFQAIIIEKASEEQKTDLFFIGWLDTYPEDYILSIVHKLTQTELRKILTNENTNDEYKFSLLDAKAKEITADEIDWFLKLSEETLSDEGFEIIDNKITDQISDETWFELWKNKATQTIRRTYLLEYFDENPGKYKEISKWLEDDIITKEKICDLLFEKLPSKKEITDRIDFYTALNVIRKLIEIEPVWETKISGLKNNLYNLILWHTGSNVKFDFNTLKGKFIYFNPDDQVYIFKRLFYLKHIGELDFTFGELDEIVRADTDLFLTNEKFNKDFVLDISTHVLIEAIKSYQTKNNFLFESDLILKDLKNNSTKKFKIKEYFEDCPGRMIADWDWKTNGKIRKILFPNDKERFYFSIEFDAAFQKEGENYYGSYTYYEKNPMFETLKDDVKKIPGRKWNPEEKHWGVPSSSTEEVYEFAGKHKFFIDLGNNKHYENNTHLINFERDETPNGILFCEGRKSNKKHNTVNREFWWCANQACFEYAEVDHLSNEPAFQNDQKKKEWEHYKFIDILRILKINTDEQKSSPPDFIPDGHYYKFIGHINAFNRLIDKLYCNHCDELLYPTESSHFALYRDTKFHCENPDCPEYEKTIYLNHCLNGECSNIIDSRISQSCDNGLYICDNCGTCCSDAMFKRRLDNLKLTGGYIHPGLLKNIEEENGHLEKAEYYCYKCRGMMTEYSEKEYRCDVCGVFYDLKKFSNIDRKWVKKKQRRKDYNTRK